MVFVKDFTKQPVATDPGSGRTCVGHYRPDPDALLAAADRRQEPQSRGHEPAQLPETTRPVEGEVVASVTA